MKYNIDKELELIAKLKIPMQPKLLPLMNKVVSLMKCKPDERVDVKKIKIPGYQGADLSALIVEPRHCEEILPCMVIFHGGGFMLKASTAHYQLIKEYAAKVPCRVVYVDYRLAPEYPFPIPVEDCYATYEWVVRHVKKLQIDPERIIISGDSAGGNLAAAVTLMAKDRGVALPAGALLVYPVTDRRMITESMQKFMDTPVWDARLSKMMWDCYLGEQWPEHIEYASPIEAESMEGFPATYMEVAEYDCLHDEGIALLQRIRETGVATELHEVKHSCHGYETAVDSLITRACMECRLEWLRRLIEN